MMNDSVKRGGKIFLYSKTFGWVKGVSQEDKGEFDGLALLNVYFNSPILPGIAYATINTNEWEVYDESNSEALKKIANFFISERGDR